MKRIRLDEVSESDEEIRYFLEHWTPAEFPLFVFNYEPIEDTWIKSNFYINSLCRTVRSVTEEVYIRYFDFSVEDLEQVIKAAFNSERLIFSLCNIHSSKPLDLSIAEKYNIKYLSFQFCGDSSEFTTDWISDPLVFSNIIDAIGGCGLRNSLEQINIKSNPSLDKENVQQLFHQKGMLQISVVEDNVSPTSP